MDYLNAFLIFLIAVYVLQGWLRGFIMSLSNTVGMAASWLVGFMFFPSIANRIAQSSFYRFIYIFTEASSHLTDQVEGHLLVSSLTEQQMSTIVGQAMLPRPFSDLVVENMKNLAYGDQYTTVAEYFDYTVTDAVVNIIAFLIIYLLCRVVIGLILNTMNFASPFPMLKHCDGLTGAALGLLRGCMAMYAVCLIIPVILISVPSNITLFSDIINGSSVASYFYRTDFLLNYIPGVIPAPG